MLTEELAQEEENMLNKKDQAYYFFKENILNQKWKIEDTINLSEVCAELKMSRTPVIESLKELEKEGSQVVVGLDVCIHDNLSSINSPCGAACGYGLRLHKPFQPINHRKL